MHVAFGCNPYPSPLFFMQAKELSSEGTNEAMDSEKHDSAAASAGSSPPPVAICMYSYEIPRNL